MGEPLQRDKDIYENDHHLNERKQLLQNQNLSCTPFSA